MALNDDYDDWFPGEPRTRHDHRADPDWRRFHTKPRSAELAAEADALRSQLTVVVERINHLEELPDKPPSKSGEPNLAVIEKIWPRALPEMGWSRPYYYAALEIAPDAWVVQGESLHRHASPIPARTYTWEMLMERFSEEGVWMRVWTINEFGLAYDSETK